MPESITKILVDFINEKQNSIRRIVEMKNSDIFDEKTS